MSESPDYFSAFEIPDEALMNVSPLRGIGNRIEPSSPSPGTSAHDLSVLEDYSQALHSVPPDMSSSGASATGDPPSMQSVPNDLSASAVQGVQHEQQISQSYTFVAGDHAVRRGRPPNPEKAMQNTTVEPRRPRGRPADESKHHPYNGPHRPWEGRSSEQAPVVLLTGKKGPQRQRTLTEWGPAAPLLATQSQFTSGSVSERQVNLDDQIFVHAQQLHLCSPLYTVYYRC
ncbi:hypothetical protein C8F01DRAFT_1142991 [Mycena amicta]|nr:hypothetical protein C8F01DRAFT_1142991 [Mycena amicta]